MRRAGVGSSSETSRRRQRRLALAAAGLLVAAALAAVVLSMRLFIWPAESPIGRADALVVLGPGLHGERFSEAAMLLKRHVAPVVVVSRSKDPRRWPVEHELCARPNAICFRAEPFTTRGEARHVGRLANLRHWRRILIVTSSYHVTRARLLFGRCVGGDVGVVDADVRMGIRTTLVRVLHEWGGLLDARIFARSC
jgi:uncharacterized SAM-binding protein YcdF (DUF218 family)